MERREGKKTKKTGKEDEIGLRYEGRKEDWEGERKERRYAGEEKVRER